MLITELASNRHDFLIHNCMSVRLHLSYTSLIIHVSDALAMRFFLVLYARGGAATATRH
jgi:hypothetical protein